jgi:peptidoglycan/xylan/chitin deacetylase (PgdA/CDA1 family)
VKYSFLSACVLVLAASMAHAADRFDIAITIDDLPNHGALPPGMTRLGIAQSQLDTFKAHHVPQVYGFVNAAGIVHEPGTEAVLDAWRKAGYPLGNHTYSHMSLNGAPSLAAWIADLKAGEPAIAQRMQGANWHYLRYPFLAAGTDQARHDGAIAYLKSHGYRIADVSVGFDDWAYSDTYARCLAKGDTASIEAMKAQYLKGVDANIARMKALSQRVYGRMIPQVLLTHIGGWSAVMLPQVMDKLDAAGAHYVTLEQAEADPAYAETDPRAGDGSLMERMAAQRGIAIDGLPASPSLANLNTLCR